MQENKPSQVNNWNYKITRFFLNNSRLTILSFLLLLILGIGSTLLLKTTGFPSPEIKLVLVQTVFPGASSDTVAKQVTIPLEGALKDIEGITTYTSDSFNSLSLISITIAANSDTNTVRSKVDSALKSVSLPVGAQTPLLISPQIGAPDIILSIADNDLSKIYQTYENLNKKVAELEQTAKIEQFNKIKQQVAIVLKPDKLRESGITSDAIQNQLKTISETIPVVTNVAIDDTNQTLSATVSNKTLEEIKNIEFVPIQNSQGQPNRTLNNSANNSAIVSSSSSISNSSNSSSSTSFASSGSSVSSSAQTSVSQSSNSISISSANPISISNPTTSFKLSELAEIKMKYFFDSQVQPSIAFGSNNQGQAVTGATLGIKAVEGADLNQFTKEVEEKIKELDNVKASFGEKVDFDQNKTNVIINLTSNKQNEEQVKEVISGLRGGPLNIENEALAQIGWLLGGIQLVFLVMLAFVSWRAAIIAALSIPLSLIFSNIYLYLIGESLNTIVLFSLVLVIGLVVDPSLVVLEALQRKVDLGLRGKEAALEAIKDVGNGIFLAALTNIIVFAPFGVISGLLGQIFAYIPATIVPATIGSYIVPLVFLSWLGAVFLKPNANSTDSEEENLWGIARALIALNGNILKSSRFLRSLIIFVCLFVPFAVAAFYVGTRQVVTTTFSSSKNGDYISFSGSFLGNQTASQKEANLQEVLELITKNKEILQVFPIEGIDNSFNYYGIVRPTLERSEITFEIAKKLDKEIKDRLGDKFFDLNIGVVSNGPPGGGYQVAIGLKTDDGDKLKNASLKLAELMRTKICYLDQKVEINADCDGEKLITKVDDGFSGKENKLIEILLDRNKLISSGLILPNAPASSLVVQSLSSQFDTKDNRSIGKVLVGNEETEIIIESEKENPKTLNEVKNTEIIAPTGQKFKLNDLATIAEKTPKSGIRRVKGQTIGLVQARLEEGKSDQGISAQITETILNYYKENDGQKAKEELGLEAGQIDIYSEGSQADFLKSFGELGIALVLAIFLTYFVLALFFNSLTQPIVIIFTIPLTFVGVFPALAYLGGGEFGFLEIIGLIILIGIVENAAIFLIDAANQKIVENWNEKQAIAYASGLRFRPVILTKLTAIASLAPLAFLSEQYRSLSIVIMFGLLTSGFTSLITTPILFIFFKWLSRQFVQLKLWQQLLFLIPIFTPFFVIYLAIADRPKPKPVRLPKQFSAKLASKPGHFQDPNDFDYY